MANRFSYDVPDISRLVKPMVEGYTRKKLHDQAIKERDDLNALESLSSQALLASMEPDVIGMRTGIFRMAREMEERGLNSDALLELANTQDKDELSLGLAQFATKGSEARKTLLSQLKPSPSIMGKYNPGDYTPESWKSFTDGGMADPGLLVRYEPPWVGKIAGVPSMAERSGSTGEVKQLGTQQEELDYESKLISARDFATAEASKIISQKQQEAKLETADSIYKSLSDSDLDLIYGNRESWIPDWMRSQQGVNLIADRDQLVSMLELAAAGEMKGQGSIQESEREILRKAATTLKNADISPQKARQALDQAMQTIYRNAGKEFNTPEQNTLSIDPDLLQYMTPEERALFK